MCNRGDYIKFWMFCKRKRPYTGLIKQIVIFLPDNQGLEKGEAPMQRNFELLNLQIDPLAKTIGGTQCLFFLILGFKDL